MIKKPWRSRFAARLVAGVSQSAAERKAVRRRLFPYRMTDGAPEPSRAMLRKAKVVAAPVEEKAAPTRKQVTWHYAKR